MAKHSGSTVQVVLPSGDLNEDIRFFNEIGFRLDNIFPSDDPAVAFMSGHDLHIRIDRDVTVQAPILHLLTDDKSVIKSGADDLIAPGGTVIRVHPKTYKLEIPTTQHRFEVRKLRDSDPWVIGRAGMLYRDLIEDRLGGSIIASHIRIPDGGPVPDMVHYHTIGFQLIFCYKGWVKLVYEDQGPPFVLHAGDCVTQPPEIRHRVLEASDNLEVIEIGVPSEHMTTIDHELELPTKEVKPEREFGGQVFCHHVAEKATWQTWRINGFECRDTGINDATRHVASVQVVKPQHNGSEPGIATHDTDILFTFVMEGQLVLWAANQGEQSLKAGDAYVIPPDLKYQIKQFSQDLELLEVALPGDFNTTIH